ncbi:TLK kinase [Babesia ovis]|uniref:TLK kinase n=1 Tax=Babesia ovis TaxID=5869 RepID=A0A9W5T918_BABOV|nr:TLK kinase [Babesia ovis]
MKKDIHGSTLHNVALKRRRELTNAPLVFVNLNDKDEMYDVPHDYPYRQNGSRAEDALEDMVYPVLPNVVKTSRNTLLPFSPASDDRNHYSNVIRRLDSQLATHVDRAINMSEPELEPPTKNKDVFSSPAIAKQRRHMLFAKQWKRNAINEYLVKHYASRFQTKDNVTIVQHVSKNIGDAQAAKKYFDETYSPVKDGTFVNMDNGDNKEMVRDWIKAGPNYSKVLSDALGKYHDFLYKKQKANTEIKRKVASTSRYFFEILAEAKECERKMNERVLVTEERFYGRKDFIAEIEKENQINRNRCKRLYAMYLQCQRRCAEWARNAHVTPNPARNITHQNGALYGDEANNEDQRHGATGEMAEATAANIADVAQNNYNLDDCNTTAAAAANPVSKDDEEDAVIHITQSTESIQEHPATSERIVGEQVDNRQSGTNQRSRSIRGTSSEMSHTPAQTDGFDTDMTRNMSKHNRMTSSSSWDPVMFGQQRHVEAPSSNATSKRSQPKDEAITPTRKIRDTEVRNAEGGAVGICSANNDLAVISAEPVTPSHPSHPNSARANELQLSNRLSSVGGVNRWIYSKMEERGELDGYKVLLNELNTLLFAKGGSVLGHHSLPQALDWLDETDANRAIIPPSQETFRDGTLYTTCSFAEIKLVKVLQGGICALRSRARSREFDAAVLQQILDANSELLELKKKLDNGRCALYKKLKRDWAERNSKWAGFPPLKRGYRLLNMLGKGGFAEVWEVLDPITLTVQAAKLHILSNDMNQIERGNVVMRVKNEIDIHKTCRTHKNIVNMKACFEMGDNMLATILELCDDGDLDHYIKLHAPVPEKLALTWTYQILEGLHYMKTLPEGRVHHCDLKPGNILKHKGNIKLADFGLSKMVPHESTRELWGGGGTIFYQPPECLIANVRNKQVVLTDKIDIWAVGCILYEMLYNCRPFGFGGGKKSVSERMYQAILGGVKFPPGDHVSDECKELILRFLAFDPQMRPSIEEAMGSHLFHTELADVF